MMKPLLILALSIIASSLSLAQSKRELVKKVLSSAKDYRGIAPILDIVQSMPEESSHLPCSILWESNPIELAPPWKATRSHHEAS